MPRIHLDERGTRLRLGEADGLRRRILIISPGQGSSGTYPADVLERDGPRVITAGTHMYVDHPGQMEERDRADVGRSIRDLAAVLESDAVWDPRGSDGPGLYAEARIVPSMAPLIDDLAEHIGVSIRGVGEADRDGNITRLVAIESVDFVTKAGRGGRVLEILESARLAEALTANELRDAVTDAVRDRYADDDTHTYVQDYSVEDGWVVFEQYSSDEETYWRASLTVGDDTVTVGDDATEVEREVTYVPVGDVSEALREARTSLTEARNVGAWFEAHIHRDFTVSADDAYASGRLTRDERIALSHAIGDALDAFTTSLEDVAPHLYDRDPYAEPDSPAIPTQEATVPTVEELQAQVADLEGRLSTVEAERDEARTNEARAREALLVRDARDAARQIVTEADHQLRDTAITRVVDTAVRGDLPTTEAGQLDRDAFATTVTEALDAEVAYLTEATGAKVTGLGEGGGTSPDDAELREANAERATKLLA